MSYSEFNSRELDLIFSVFNLINNAFDADEFIDQPVFSKKFIPIIEDFINLNSSNRHEILNLIYKELNFKSYAELSGNPEMANALMKVAEDMSKMDSKSLQSIASGGLAKLIEGASAQK